jgi:hypothetical protein
MPKGLVGPWWTALTAFALSAVAMYFALKTKEPFPSNLLTSLSGAGFAVFILELAEFRFK